MLTIAGGIILAVLILAFWPVVLGAGALLAIGALVLLGFGALIMLFTDSPDSFHHLLVNLPIIIVVIAVLWLHGQKPNKSNNSSSPEKDKSDSSIEKNEHLNDELYDPFEIGISNKLIESEWKIEEESENYHKSGNRFIAGRHDSG